MNVFFDTSALVKFFNVEQGTDRVTELILNRRNQINNFQLNEAISGFNDQLTRFNFESLNQLILDEAGTMLQAFGKD